MKKIFENIAEMIGIEKKNDFNITENGELTYVGNKSRLKDELVIPAEVNGIKVETIGFKAFEDCKFLKSVVIPNGVIEIDRDAFRNCTSLESVIISDDVTVIRGDSFAECLALKSIEIPQSVVSVEINTFIGCTSLEKVVIPKHLATEEDFWDAFTYIPNENCPKLNEIVIDDKTYTLNEILNSEVEPKQFEIMNGELLYIGDKAELKGELVIPEEVDGVKVAKLSDNIFGGCKNLKKVVIPDSVVSIGNEAFRNCVSLESVNIPKNVTEIGKYAFFNCIELRELRFPENITEFKEGAFSACNNLEKVYVSENLKSIEFNKWDVGLFEHVPVKTMLVIGDKEMKLSSYYFENAAELDEDMEV